MTFVHLRHKAPSVVDTERELILAIPPLRSNVNLARIIRAAGCAGIRRAIVAGDHRIDLKIARDSLEVVEIERRRSLHPVLQKLKRQGDYALVGLEQTTESQPLHGFAFPQKTVLVIGHEREGIDDKTLALLDAAVEIPVFGKPLSFNVATATAIALYEFRRQCLVINGVE